ncbi:MAG: hypothetical protein ABW046_23410 [Actinoplanes sp.]
MKFFSNEAAKDNPDYDDDREQAKHAAAEPVSVPQQRGGSPWSDAPGNPDTVDDPVRNSDDVRDNRDEPYQDDLDGPKTESSTTTTYGPDGTVTETHTDKPVDSDAVKDEGTFDSPKAVEPATGEPLDGDRAEGDRLDGEKDDKYNKFDNSVDDLDLDLERHDADKVEADKVEAGQADAAKTDSELVAADDKTDDKTEPADTTPVVTEPAAGVAAVPATPAAVSTPAPTDRIFADGDSFTDRFREVQLKFVDSPKEATAEAATLVTEVIDKLSETLKGQQKALAGDSDDTEKLRVELRGYRDILNRLLAL